MEIQDTLSELTSGEDGRAEAAVAALARLADEAAGEVLAVLQSLLASPQADERWWAARALAAVPHPAVAGLLAAALGDADASVRQCAALGLRLHPDAPVIPALIAALDDPDALAADLATDALVSNGQAAVPALLEALKSGTRTARLKAVRALATIQDPRAIPALFAALDEDSALMEYWATEGLERMGVGMMFFKP